MEHAQHVSGVVNRPKRTAYFVGKDSQKRLVQLPSCSELSRAQTCLTSQPTTRCNVMDIGLSPAFPTDVIHAVGEFDLERRRAASSRLTPILRADFVALFITTPTDDAVTANAICESCHPCHALLTADRLRTISSVVCAVADQT